MRLNLFSYIVAFDYGFAPNPFFGACTLATCKPAIRRSSQPGDWIVGTGAKGRYGYQGRLIFAMIVDEVLSLNGYWDDPRFQIKKPLLNGSLKQAYGDNIYTKVADVWRQENSHHSNRDGTPNTANIVRDTGVNRMLIGRRFAYYGDQAPIIPDRFRRFGSELEDICCVRQGQKSNYSIALVTEFCAWVEQAGMSGMRGLPLEFARQQFIQPA